LTVIFQRLSTWVTAVVGGFNICGILGTLGSFLKYAEHLKDIASVLWLGLN
jgi:hypothetical protein